MNGSTGILLLQMLEMRLDSIVFRLGIASTIPESRQLINHGHIIVNNQSVTIPSFQCKKGDVIEIKQKSKNNISKSLNPVSLPKFLEFDTENLVGRIKYILGREEVGLNINELLVVEYYSRK